jgi:hypothetical protein
MRISVWSLVAAMLVASAASAATVQVRVMVENLAPTNSVAFAPLRVGFNNGTFDSFNVNQTATAPIISIAEGGSGADWFPAFMAAQPSATLGTVVPTPAGPLVPGATASAVFTVDTMVNQFFTFGSMVVPSNDHFIGNDSPTQYRLFDNAGNLLISTINQSGRDIWDAGSEVESIAGAAFLVNGTNSVRIPDTDVVTFDFAGLNTFNGETTGAGYVFNNSLAAATPVYRISFTAVPEPATAALVAIGAVAMIGLRRKK